MSKLDNQIKEILEYWIRGYENGSQGKHYTKQQAKQAIKSLVEREVRKARISELAIGNEWAKENLADNLSKRQSAQYFLDRLSALKDKK